MKSLILLSLLKSRLQLWSTSKSICNQFKHTRIKPYSINLKFANYLIFRMNEAKNSQNVFERRLKELWSSPVFNYDSKRIFRAASPTFCSGKPPIAGNKSGVFMTFRHGRISSGDGGVTQPRTHKICDIKTLSGSEFFWPWRKIWSNFWKFGFLVKENLKSSALMLFELKIWDLEPAKFAILRILILWTKFCPNLMILVSLESWDWDLSKFGKTKLVRDPKFAKIENLDLGLRIQNFDLN